MITYKAKLFCRKLLALLLTWVVVASCSEDDSNSNELLTGSWKLKTDVGYTQETLTFNTDGTYKIVDYAYVLGTAGNSTIEKATLKGNFEFNVNTINFLTAEIEFYEEAELDKTLLTTSGSTIGSFYGYNQVGVFSDTNYVVRSIISNMEDYSPVVWEVIELSESLLKVKKDAFFFEYEKE